MKILHISYNLDIRCLKESLAARTAGHQNLYLCCFIANDEYRYELEAFSLWDQEKGPFEKCEYFQDVDIVHVHYEPKFGHYLSRLRNSFKNIPIILDAHDLDVFRFKDYDPDEGKNEERAIQEYDAVIHTSNRYKKLVNEKYDLKGKPQEIIYGKVFPEITRIEPLPPIRGIMYQGGIDAGVKHTHRDYRPLAKWFSESNIPFHIFAGNAKFEKNYIGTNAIFYPPKPYFKLMRFQTRFDWGLCAAPFEQEQYHWDIVMPNKLFEYAACGLPILTWGDSEIAEYVKEHEIGIVLDKIEDLYCRYGEHAEIRNKMKDKRGEFSFESELPKLMKIYEDTINGF